VKANKGPSPQAPDDEDDDDEEDEVNENRGVIFGQLCRMAQNAKGMREYLK